jgi:hypothetical protein
MSAPSSDDNARSAYATSSEFSTPEERSARIVSFSSDRQAFGRLLTPMPRGYTVSTFLRVTPSLPDITIP